MEKQIRKILGRLSNDDDDLSDGERRDLEETLKAKLAASRERTGACKHNMVLSYLMHCQRKTVVFGWHRDLIEDLALKLRQQGRGVVTYIGGTKEPGKVVERFQDDERIQFF